jgi:hypothetical protein
MENDIKTAAYTHFPTPTPHTHTAERRLSRDLANYRECDPFPVSPRRGCVPAPAPALCWLVRAPLLPRPGDRLLPVSRLAYQGSSWSALTKQPHTTRGCKKSGRRPALIYTTPAPPRAPPDRSAAVLRPGLKHTRYVTARVLMLLYSPTASYMLTFYYI